MPRLPTRPLLLGLLLVACSAPATTPQQALEEFFRCTLAGDDAAARAMLVTGEQGDPMCKLDPAQLAQGYVLGSTDEDAGRACILVDQKGAKAAMRWMLVRENGNWHVSLKETARASFGGDGARPTEMAAELARLSGDLQERAKAAATTAKAPKPPKPSAPPK